MWRGVGIGLKVAWGVGGSEGVPFPYSPRQLLEVSLSPPPFYPWERILVNMARAFSWSHSVLWDCRRSQTATRAGKCCHRNTCSGFHFVLLEFHFLLWQHNIDVRRSTLVGSAIAVSIMHWIWTLCCWLLMCVSEVQFSSWHKPGQSLEHAVRLCTTPLFLYHMLSVVMLFNHAVCVVKQVVYSTELQELCCGYGQYMLGVTICNNV